MTTYDNVMRTIIDLPTSQKLELQRLAKAQSLSLAELIRRAVSQYLQTVGGAPSLEANDAFGCWKDRTEDSLSYEMRLREEWTE